MGTVTDHKLAALQQLVGESGSVQDLESAFWAGLLDGSVALNGAELVSRELAANPANIGAAVADIAGLSFPVTAPNRKFRLELEIPAITIATAQAYVFIQITDAANAVLNAGYAQVQQAGYSAWPFRLSVDLPKIGGGASAYPIVPGQEYTFKVRANTSAGAATIQTTGGQARPTFRAVMAA